MSVAVTAGQVIPGRAVPATSSASATVPTGSSALPCTMPSAPCWAIEAVETWTRRQSLSRHITGVWTLTAVTRPSGTVLLFFSVRPRSTRSRPSTRESVKPQLRRIPEPVWSAAVSRPNRNGTPAACHTSDSTP